MTRKRVTSGAIRSIGYDPTRQDMDIQFKNGEVYTYHPISQRKYENLMNAQSIGNHFHRNVKNAAGITVKKLMQ